MTPSGSSGIFRLDEDPSVHGPQQAPAGGVQSREAASLVQQYVGVSPRSPDDLLSGGGALRRGRRARSGHDDNDEDTQHHTLRQASTPAEAAAMIQRCYRAHRLDLALRERSFSKFGAEALSLIRQYVETGESGRGLYEEDIVVKARLVLHFDINKTVLMTDKAQGANTDFMLNVLLSECAWGRLEPGPAWVPVGRLATDRPTSDIQLMTYRSYLDSFLLPFRPGAGPEAQAANGALKNRRQALKRKFTEPGEPGEMFRGVFQRLKDALALPQACREKAANSSLAYLFGNGERHILPSFFNLLKHLQAQRREFAIVFRTFGADICEVMDEMNMFAAGQHPCYPEVRMDGSDGRVDLRMRTPGDTGAFVRTTAKADGSMLLMGADEAVLRSKELSPELLGASGSGRLLTDFGCMHEALMAQARRGNRAYALRDFYPFWKTRNERSRAGKLLLLDPADDDVIQIFFDDNVGHGQAHIVDTRDAATGASLPFQDVVGRHVLKVEPLNAILDPHYFVRAVHGCVLAVLAQRAQRAQQPGGASSALDARQQQSVGGSAGQGAGQGTAAPLRRPPAHHSRRARDLWSIVQQRLTAVIRVRDAMQDQ